MRHTSQIVDAARRLIAEKGEAFTTQELVKEAGVALQTFYRHFSGKDQLLLAVLEQTVSEACEDYGRQAKELADPLARLRFTVTVAMGGLDETDLASQRLITAEHYRLHQLFPDELAEATRSYRDLIRQEIEAAQAAGELPRRDVDRSAWFIQQLVQATFHHYAFAARDRSVEEISQELWAFCLAAIGGEDASLQARTPRRRRTSAPKST